MGCPPDPVEVSIWRSGERIAALQEKYDRLVGQYDEAVAFAARLGIVDDKRFPAFGGRRFETRTQVAPSEWDQFADATDQFRLERECAAAVKELESALCELRTEIIRHERAISPELRAQFDRNQALHREHRREDRAQWIVWLKGRAELLRFLLNEPVSPEPPSLDRPAAEQMIRDIHREIKRLKSIPDHALMRNREVLAADPEKWKIPYLD